MAKGNNLLGKKREVREEDSDSCDDLKKTKREKENLPEPEDPEEEFSIEESENNESNSEENDNSSSSEDNKEEKKEAPSLFGNTKLTSTGLFGNLNGDKADAKSSDKATDAPKLFSNTGASNLFSSSSLFSQGPTGSSLFSAGSNTLFSAGSNSLFSSTSNSLFGAKPLFSFSSATNTGANPFASKKDDDEDEDKDEGDDGDNDLFKTEEDGNATSAADKQPKVAVESVYTKKYNKEADNIFIFVKEDNKFVSKGKGYLSLEFAEVDAKKIGVVVFRNNMGSKIIEGFLNSNLKKLEKYVKNFKHVASFSFLQKDKSNKFAIGYAKVPFAREEDLKEFEKVYNEILASLEEKKQ